ncbi:DMT family transporter, partial [Pararhizobium sp.]|uniref:DMT family transporter n=1 Tax=Pararhizobium sp. TaxID=1977563 RepID=UPI0027197056
PITVSVLRWLIPAVLMWPWVRPHLPRDWPIMRAHWKILLWLGLTGGAFFTAFQYIGLQYTSAINVSVMNSLVPVLILATGALLFSDRIGLRQVGGIALSLAGVLAIIAHGQFETLLNLGFNWGDLIILSNMIVFSVYAVCLRRLPDIHPLSFLFTVAIITIVSTAPFAVWEAASGNRLSLDWLTAGSIVYVSLFSSLIAFIAWNRGVELIGASRAGPFLHLVPVCTALVSGLLLGEHLAIYHVAGFAVILAGVWLAAKRSDAAKAAT